MNEAYAGGDLSLRRDLTSLVVVVRERARRPEAGDHLVVRSVETWDPKASPTTEVDFAEVRAALERLPRRFPALKSVLVDAAAESSSVLPWCRQHPRLSLLVHPFTATADSNMQLWSALVARLNARTISLPRHERLLAELRGLRAESFAFGAKWRVVDSSRRFHRDVSFSLALAVFAAGAARTCTSPLCDDPECDGRGPLMMLFGAESAAWERRHPSPEALAEREVQARLASLRARVSGGAGALLASARSAVATATGAMTRMAAGLRREQRTPEERERRRRAAELLWRQRAIARESAAAAARELAERDRVERAQELEQVYRRAYAEERVLQAVLRHAVFCERWESED